MSETRAANAMDSGELTEALRRARDRFGEFRGRL
jgi:hypothetical protein